MKTNHLRAGALCGMLGLASAGYAAPPTFNAEVLPILQENCQACHRSGGANLGGMVAPMAFETYDDVRPWAKSIAKSVQTRSMPPWHAAPQHAGVFANERTMSEEDIATIVGWAQSGAKRGNPKDAPVPIAWPDHDGWTIGEPDLVVQPDEAFFVGDDVDDLYVNHKTTVTAEMLSEDRYIKAVEFRPGSKVVHHIITFPLGGIAPGNEANVYPDGIAATMKAGEDLEWQMHYNKEAGPGTGVWDQSSAAIKFYDDPSKVKYRMQGADLATYDFKIPAGAPDFAIVQEYTFNHDSRITQYMPHFHLRGIAAKYEAFYPDGTQEVLLDIPGYDFNWQTAYKYNDFKKVPKGTKVVFTSSFDNSAGNPANPDATVPVRFGEPTWDEMSFGYMGFINDSGEHESFFGDFVDGTPNIVSILWVSDHNHDEKMSKEEAPKQFQAYWGMIDKNKDGFVDLAEAEAATAMMAKMSGSTD